MHAATSQGAFSPSFFPPSFFGYHVSRLTCILIFHHLFGYLYFPSATSQGAFPPSFFSPSLFGYLYFPSFVCLLLFSIICLVTFWLPLFIIIFPLCGDC